MHVHPPPKSFDIHKWLMYLEYISGNCLIGEFEVLNKTGKIYIYFNLPGTAVEGVILAV